MLKQNTSFENFRPLDNCLFVNVCILFLFGDHQTLCPEDSLLDPDQQPILLNYTLLAYSAWQIHYAVSTNSIRLLPHTRLTLVYLIRPLRFNCIRWDLPTWLYTNGPICTPFISVSFFKVFGPRDPCHLFFSSDTRYFGQVG